LTSTPQAMPGDSRLRSRMRGLRPGGSRFIDRTDSQVSTRCHGQSGREDVLSGIDVGVGLVSTDDTREQALRASRFASDHSTAGTTLARVRGWDFNNTTASAFGLVYELPTELAPALRQDGAIQPRLCSNSYAGPLGCSARRASEAHHVQIFDHNHAVVLGDVGRELIEEVSANSGLPGTQASNLIQRPLVADSPRTHSRCAPPARSFLAAGLSTQPAQPFLLTGWQARGTVNLTRGGSNSRSDASIKSDRRQRSWRRAGSRSCGTTDRNMPSEGISSNGQVTNCAFGVAGPSEADPPELRYPHLAPFPRDATYSNLTISRSRLNAKSVAASLAPWFRITGQSCKEADVPAIEVTQRLLKHIGMWLPQPLACPLDVGEFSSPLIGVAKADPLHAPGTAALLQAGVIDRASTAGPARQRLALTDCGIEAIAIPRVIHWEQFARQPGQNRAQNVRNYRRISSACRPKARRVRVR
jgi:hypothetical protein